MRPIRKTLAYATIVVLLPPTSALAEYIQGYKIDAEGLLYNGPGATLAFRSASGIYGPTSGQNPYLVDLPPGTYELGLYVPSGYEAAYSLCLNCILHPEESYISYGPYNSLPLLINIEEGEFVDLWWKLTKVADPSTDLAEKLTCNVGGRAVPAATVVQSASTPAFNVEVGLSQSLGGVSVAFKLANAAFPEQWVQILDARSAAGAAWQSSVLMADPASRRILVFNQAAGNMMWQWGFDNEYIALLQQRWNPIFTDHYHPNMDFASPQINTSPCYHSGYIFDDGKLAMTMDRLPTARGDIVRITNDYLLRARVNQDWEWWRGEQAFYLMRDVARERDLRVYLIGEGGAWYEGPIRPYDPFSVTHAEGGGCVGDGSRCEYKTLPISYVVLVWDVNGVDVAIAIDTQDSARPFHGHLALTKHVECATEDDVCGNVEWHSFFADSVNYPMLDPVHFQVGDVRHYSMTYDVGTPAALDGLGFSISAPTAAACEDRFMAGDFDGDGAGDSLCMVNVENGGMAAWVYLSRGGAFVAQRWLLSSPSALDGTRCADRYVAADMNGDHMTDVACAYAYTEAHHAAMLVWRSTGTGFVLEKWHDSGVGNFDAARCDGRFIAADVNGDARSDVVCGYEYVDTDQTGTFVWRSTGTGFVLEKWHDSGVGNFAAARCNGRYIAADVNGDGHSDVVCGYQYAEADHTGTFVWRSTGTSFVLEKWHDSGVGNFDAARCNGRYVAANVNGDGYSDIVCGYQYADAHHTGTFVWLSTGTGFTIQKWHDSGPGNFDAARCDNRYVSGDIDHDGDTDVICGYRYDEPLHIAVFVWKSSGSAFAHEKWYESTGGIDLNLCGRRFVVEDLNRDQHTDIVCGYDMGSSPMRAHVFSARPGAFQQEAWW